MIVFDLKCGEDHVFEAWFASSQAYEDQRAAHLVSCPFCGSDEIAKAVMAPRLAAKGNQVSSGQGNSDRIVEGDVEKVDNGQPSLPLSNRAEQVEQLRTVLTKLADAQRKALESSQWVGRDFADRARAMHYGEEDQNMIHGESSRDEAERLVEEGIAVAPLLFPVVPPEAKN